MSPVGAIFVLFPPKTGTNLLHPRPLSIVERVVHQFGEDEPIVTESLKDKSVDCTRACRSRYSTSNLYEKTPSSGSTEECDR